MQFGFFPSYEYVENIFVYQKALIQTFHTKNEDLDLDKKPGRY